MNELNYMPTPKNLTTFKWTDKSLQRYIETHSIFQIVKRKRHNPEYQSWLQELYVTRIIEVSDREELHGFL